MRHKKQIKLTYQSSTFLHIDRNQKEGRWVMMPDVGKSITAYYDLEFYETFPKSDFAQPCDFVYVGFLETLLKDPTSLQYNLRKVCVIMKQFWSRALTKNVNELISAKCCVFLSFFNFLQLCFICFPRVNCLLDFQRATKLSVTLSLKIVERAFLSSPYISETNLHNYVMYQAL